jgi:parvulin-like peptidyl-prolyl isomerase/tetratricopeptide (TPR) repeat protein
MRKSFLLIPVLAAIAAISACGNSGEKGRVLARIAGQTFTEGDLDLRLSVHDDLRRTEILANSDLRRAEFESILRSRLHALAGLASKHGKSKDLHRRLASQDQRVHTQYYFETFLGLQGGLTRAEIEAYYKANAARFTDDSGRTLSLGHAFSRVVDSLIVQKGAVDSFHLANGQNYRVRPSAEVSLIRTTSRQQADAALRALRGGAAFGATAKRFSVHDTKNAEGKLGRINQGDFNDALGPQSTIDSLLFNEFRLKPGQTSGIVQASGGFNIVRVEAYTAEKIPSLDEIGDLVRGDFVRDYKSRISQNAVATLKDKHEVRFVSQDKQPTEKEILAYYNQHKGEYESPETFEVYHIESSDEAALTSAVDAVENLESFKALATRISSNEMTRAQKGYIGVIKRDFSLPYGIGMMPALYPALDEVESGKIGELVQNPATQTWHAFWLVKKGEPTAKPFDRVRPLVIQDLKANRIANVQPGDTLAVIGKGGKSILERDVLFLRSEIPENIQERYTRESLVDFLIIWEIFTAESKNLGLDKERKLRAQRLSNEDNFWAGVYRDSVLIHTWEETPSKLEKTFKANRDLFTRDSNAKLWKPFARDIAAFHLLTARDFEIEYNTSPDRYMRDSLMIPFAEAKPAVFEALKPVGYARLDAAVLDKLKKRFKVRIEDNTLLEPSLEPAAVHYKRAQDLHYERKLDQAMSLYERLRVTYPGNDALQDSISFGIAQIYIEQERYAQALSEYRRVNYLYPKSPNDYKAMFMIGFIQAEHMRQDSAAVRSFEAMLKKYPESDLSDDADWMIRNIRSGGQLMPVLEEDLEEGGMSKEQGK